MGKLLCFQACFDEYKISNDEALEKINTGRSEEAKRIQMEINSTKDSIDALKSQFETFVEATNTRFECIEKDAEIQKTSLDEVEAGIVILGENAEASEKKLVEVKDNIMEVIQSVKEEEAESSKHLRETLTKEVGKVLDVLSETKMEIKADQENIVKSMNEDRETVDMKTKQLHETFENTSVGTKEKLVDNLRIMNER